MKGEWFATVFNSSETQFRNNRAVKQSPSDTLHGGAACFALLHRSPCATLFITVFFLPPLT
ncbi:MAG TPA: hypothetical protein PKM61_05555, partial [bacterium]|nr:hypothetical protein [bacterium]